MITQRFGRGVRIVFIEYIIVAITGLLFFAFLGRIMSLEEIGLFSLITFIITILVTIIEFSAGAISSQLIGSVRGEGKQEVVPGIVRSSLKMVLSIAVIVFSVVISYVFIMQLVMFDFLLTLLVITIPLITGIRVVFFGFLLGLEKFGIKSGLAITVFVFPKILGLYFVAFLGAGLGGLVFSLLIGELVTLLLCILIGKVPLTGGTKFPIRQIFWLGSALSVILFLVRFFDYIDRLVIFFGAGDLYALGAYDLSMRLLAPLLSLTTVITSVSLPILSHIISQNTQSTREYISTLLRFYFVLFMPFFVFLALTVNGQLPQIIYGTSYPSLGVIFSILVIASLFQGLLLVGINFLQAIGERNIFIQVGVPVILLDIILTWLLLPLFGGVGIAIMRLFSYTLASVLILFILWKKIRPSLELVWMYKLVALSIIVALPIVLMNHLTWPLWILFFVEGGIAFCTFISGVRLLGIIEKKDRKHLVATFPILKPLIRILGGE